MARHVLLVLLAWSSAAAVAASQTLPDGPISAGGGRLVLGVDVAASIAPDDPGFFNYSDYEHSTLRELRLALGARVRLTDRVSVLGDVRTENFDRLALFALYARVTPLPGRRLDVQIGRIPPVFGRFPRQAYGHRNPLIGSPLAYQYLTSLRADAVPATADELLAMRGRGWLSAFTIGSDTPARGVPLVTAAHWDAGVQVSTGWKALDVAVSITNGTPSRPRISDDNSGKQLAARAAVTPLFGLTIGASAARGDFLAREVVGQLPDAHRGRTGQDAYGIDAEYSRGHGLVRTEIVLSRWEIPMPAEPRPVRALQALGVSVEGRYTVWPGAYVAARGDHLTFSRVTGTAGPARWDAPVTRVEIGGGYHLQRNVLARAAFQLNWRDGGRVTRARLLAGQLLYWF
jgi:hypothetical protein